MRNEWDRRKKYLKENGWTYNKSTEMWDSSDSSCEFSQDLKIMSETVFVKKVKNTTK